MNVCMPRVRKPPGGVLLILDLVFGKNFGFILEKIFLSKIFSGASTARRLLICLAVRVPSGSLEERRHLFLGVASASPALHCWWCRGCVLLAFHCKRYSFGSMLRNRAAPFFCRKRAVAYFTKACYSHSSTRWRVLFWLYQVHIRLCEVQFGRWFLRGTASV